MDSNKWDEIQSLFHQCVQLPLNEQGRFIEELEKEDSSFAIDVKKLLEAYHSSGTFLEEDILDEAFIKSGDRIGPWKNIQVIGRGGMSTVFLASRADGQFERQVAIKFFHGLIPGRSMHQRLQISWHACNIETLPNCLTQALTTKAAPILSLNILRETCYGVVR